jgi:hypothetical protein
MATSSRGSTIRRRWNRETEVIPPLFRELGRPDLADMAAALPDLAHRRIELDVALTAKGPVILEALQ